jgi:hypothetical protein
MKNWPTSVTDGAEIGQIAGVPLMRRCLRVEGAPADTS